MAQKKTWRSDEVARNDAALLRAAREVVAEDGVHASVAAIAARAGVGVGTLYRRYRTKDELFARLAEIAAEQYLAAAREALESEDPWSGIVSYALVSVRAGPGSLAPIAGTIRISEKLADMFVESEQVVDALVERAQRAGVIREGITTADFELLIEQLTKSPMVEQLRRHGRTDLVAAARQAHERIVLIALDGLRGDGAVTGTAPGYELLTERWSTPDSSAGS